MFFFRPWTKIEVKEMEELIRTDAIAAKLSRRLGLMTRLSYGGFLSTLVGAVVVSIFMNPGLTSLAVFLVFAAPMFVGACGMIITAYRLWVREELSKQI